MTIYKSIIYIDIMVKKMSAADSPTSVRLSDFIEILHREAEQHGDRGLRGHMTV